MKKPQQLFAPQTAQPDGAHGAANAPETAEGPEKTNAAQTTTGETAETAQDAAAKNTGVRAALKNGALRAGAACKKVLAGIGAFCKKHKLLSSLIAVALILAVAAALLLPRFSQRSAAQAMRYVRTVTLSKTSLSDTISATGSIGSADVSSVTTNLNYTVKTINVQVGDEVQAGDVILTLDTSELSEKIAKAKSSLEEAVDKAYASYTAACNEYTDAVAARDRAKTALAAAQADYDSAKSVCDAAVSAVAAQQSAYNAARTDAAAKKTQSDLAWIDFAAAVAACPNGHTTADTVFSGAGCDCERCYIAWDAAQTAHNTAAASESAALTALDSAKSAVNYAAAESAYSAQKAVYDPLYNAYTAAQSSVSAKAAAKSNAYTAYVNSQSSDTLNTLYDEYEKCTLVAETSGKVTSLNATVGSSVNGTAATIQDTGNLIVSISIAEYDIKSVEVGMRCVITSDATDAEIGGTLSMISPVANSATGMGGGSSSSSTFDAQVTVLGGDNGLLIGMNATVEIILSSVDDVYSVPYDAVGADENGDSIVYVMTNDDALNPVFETMAVTTGESNDYYIEISGAELYEGMVIRASAVEEEAVTDTPSQSGDAFSMFGGGQSGGMPSGGNMPSGGGMPSGNFGGGRG